MFDQIFFLASLSAPSEVAHVNFGLAGEAALEVSHYFMVGRLLKLRPNATGFMGTIPSIWRQRSGLQIHSEGDRFMFQFDREANHNKVLHGGPWFYQNAMLVTVLYDEIFVVVTPPLHSIETWVSILGLPHLLRNKKSLQLIRQSIGKVHCFDNLAINRKDEKQKIHLTMDTRQRYRFYRNYCFASVHVDVEIIYEKIQGLCNFCGLFEHAVEGCDKLFVREDEALHGLRVTAMEELTIAKSKLLNGGFLSSDVALKAEKYKEEAVQLAAKVKVQLPEKHLMVNDELTARVLKACKAGGFVVSPLVEQQQSAKRGRKRTTERPLIQLGKKMLEVSGVLSPKIKDLNLSLPNELGRLLVTPPKKKGGRSRGSINKPKEGPPRPTLKGRKRLLKILEDNDMIWLCSTDESGS